MKPRKTPPYTFAPHHPEASGYVGGPQRPIRSPFTVLKIQLQEDLDGKRRKPFVILSTQLALRGQRRTNYVLPTSPYREQLQNNLAELKVLHELVEI